MNVAFVVNDAYTIGAVAMLRSLVANNSGEHEVFMIHGSDISPQSLNYIKTCLPKNSIVTFHDIVPDISDVENMGIPKDRHFGHDVWLKILIPFVLPKEIDKCLMIDCDTIVKGDISEMYDADISNLYASVCRDRFDSSWLNSGVMVLNLKKIRNDHRRNDIVRWTIDNMATNRFADQDVYVEMFGIDVRLFDWLTYNCLILSYTGDWPAPGIDSKTAEYVYKYTKIIHFVGSYKPFMTPRNVDRNDLNEIQFIDIWNKYAY